MASPPSEGRTLICLPLRQTKNGGGRDEHIHEMGVYNGKAGTERRGALNNDMWLEAF